MSAPDDQRDTRDLERETARALDQWTEDLQADLEASQAGATADDRAAALRVFEQEAAAPRPGRRRFAWLAAAGLVACLAGGLALLGDGEAPGKTPTFLGEESIVELSPQGPGDGYDRFQWKLNPDKPGSFVLRVWNTGDLEPVLTAEGLTESRYDPTPEQLERLGPSILWEIALVSLDGRTLASASAEASRP